MLEGLRYFGEAFIGFMSPMTLVNVLWATQLGIIVGMLPGLTATMGVALMTTLTFKMPASEAVLSVWDFEDGTVAAVVEAAAVPTSDQRGEAGEAVFVNDLESGDLGAWTFHS